MPRPKPSSPAWQPGQSGNPKGRPTGSRNKLNEKFILALHDDFVAHGPKVIARVREEKPDIYLKVIASILPRELHVKEQSMFDGMTNEQLDEILGSVRAIIATRAPTGLGDGKAPPSGQDKLN